MKLIVDSKQRFAKMRAHTAAHLLHGELVKIFPNTKQAGSFVDEDYLRFDFVADRALTNEELVTIQKNINQIIYDGLAVSMTEMSYKDAIASGAKAFFEDKYGDMVRVVKIDGDVSTELCGGTHAHNTKDIGCFVLLGQEAVASGVKRISAVTGPKVYEQIEERDVLLDNISSKLGVNSKQLVDKTEKLIKEIEEEKKINLNLNKQLINIKIEAERYVFESFDSVFKMDENMDLKTAAVLINENVYSQNILICNNKGNYIIISGLSNAKNLAEKFKFKGGGNDKMFQGKDDKIKSIYDNAERFKTDKTAIVNFTMNSLSTSGSQLTSQRSSTINK